MARGILMMHVHPSEVIKTLGGRPIGVEVIEPCGGEGYEYKHRPYLGEQSDARNVINPSPVINGQPLHCLSCGQPMGPNSSEPMGGWADPPPEPTPQ